MSRAVSISSSKPYGVARVAAVWQLPRSSFYAALGRERNPREPLKRGPKVLCDAELLSAIRTVLEESMFTGEGYRKVWARLRSQRHPHIESAREPADAGEPAALSLPPPIAGNVPAPRRRDRHQRAESDAGHRRHRHSHGRRRLGNDLRR